MSNGKGRATPRPLVQKQVDYLPCRKRRFLRRQIGTHLTDLEHHDPEKKSAFAFTLHMTATGYIVRPVRKRKFLAGKDYDSANLAPDFFIVGAARCGTTSLHSWLNRHPAIQMTNPDKEPGYYCDFWGVETFAEYRRNFGGAGKGQLLGDASTHYMTSPNTPAILRKANPDARIIINLRNPADRAFSLFRFMQCQGYENIEDFDEALEAEPERRTRFLGPGGEAITYPYNYLYFQTGLYHEQLQRFFQSFPRPQILVIIFEEMIRDQMTTYKRIMEHLGLPSEEPTDSLLPMNGSWKPRSLMLQNLLKQKLFPLCQSLRLPHHKIYRTLSNLNMDDSIKSKISPATRQRLLETYREDIDATAKLLGRPLDVWR